MSKSNVFEVDFTKEVNDDMGILYVTDGNGSPIGVSNTSWNFSISRSDDNKRIAFVCDNGESFGELEAEEFNTMLLCWLLIDDPKMIDDFAGDE